LKLPDSEGREMTVKVKVWKCLSLIFIIIFALSTACVVQAAGVTATITVGFAPLGIAYDSAKGEIFVATAGSPGGFNVTSQAGTNTVFVISDSTNTVVARIDMGTPTGNMVYDSGKGEIYATAYGGNKVYVISDSDNSIVATVTVGTYPNGEAYDSAKGEIYVCNGGDGTVSVISDSTHTVVATIKVGANPKGAAYDSAKGEIFITNGNGNTVSVISDSTHTVVATINLPEGNGPNYVAYDPAKGEIFVTDSDNLVYVISDSTNAVVATVDLNLNHAVSPDGLAYDSSRGEMFVANFATNDVSIISDSTNTVVETVNLPLIDNFAGPFFLAYDSAKGEVFVTNQALNTVSVISDSTSTSASTTPSTSTTTNPTLSPSSTPSSGSPGFNSIVWIIAIIVIILLIIIILIWLRRQRKFIVTVQNSQTQSPITGANVSGSGPKDLSGTTNNKGQTVFNDFKDGDYSIKASATGYIASMPISVSAKNKTEVVIKLNPTPSEAPKKDYFGSGPDNQGNPTFNLAKETQQTQPPMQSEPIIAPIPPPPPSPQQPPEPQSWRDEKIQQIIQKFQDKGATSPQTALTAKELGLSRIFVRIMERRREHTKMFVEVNGKYYLDQKALDENKQ
jgi:YVTN family beta-propeller protein